MPTVRDEQLAATYVNRLRIIDEEIRKGRLVVRDSIRNKGEKAFFSNIGGNVQEFIPVAGEFTSAEAAADWFHDLREIEAKGLVHA